MTARNMRRAGLGVLGVLALAGPVAAEEKAVRVIVPGRLMALVIGNETYAEAPLRNPVNDARAVAGVLREKLGFAEENVELYENLASHEELTLAVEEFGQRLRATDLAFFYYSGHGMAVERKNYLLPTGFGGSGRVEDRLVRFRALGEGAVRAALEPAQLRVLVLDACRNNPYGTGRSASQGLVPAGSSTQGELLAYAAGEGKTATDLGQGLGLYARHLVAALQAPGVELAAVFRRVGNLVYAETQGKQAPETVQRLLGTEFYFVPKAGGPGPGTAEVPPGPATQPDPRGGSEGGGGLLGVAERQWADVLASQDPAVLEAFARDFKDVKGAGSWVAEAKRLAAELRKLPVVDPLPERPREWRNDLGMEFVRIEAGAFLMGSPEGEAGRYEDEGPVHAVRISRPFYLGKYEVTQREWKAVMGKNPSRFQECGERCPVEQVSRNEVQEFIEKLNRRESGRGYEYRLPTEAEWEYAARGGTRGATPEGELELVGDDAPVLDGQAWYGGNSRVGYDGGEICLEWENRMHLEWQERQLQGERIEFEPMDWATMQYEPERCGPHPVGEKRANPWGLHDMLGNVAELVWDWYGEYPSGAVTDPRGPGKALFGVIRGGNWLYIARAVRSAFRDSDLPGGRGYDLGFRLARTESP